MCELQLLYVVVDVFVEMLDEQLLQCVFGYVCGSGECIDVQWFVEMLVDCVEYVVEVFGFGCGWVGG